MYVENQSDFYNMVMLGTLSDEYTPHKLLEYIHRVESLLGRNRAKEIRFGPRSIDIDIEFFGDFFRFIRREIVDKNNLVDEILINLIISFL